MIKTKKPIKTTSHSEYNNIKILYLKKIQDAFQNQAFVNSHWESLNYLNEPNYNSALSEYKIFENIIKSSGCDIHYFNNDHDTGMDSLYCRDASIATDFGMIICNMGKGQRMGEPAAQERVFNNHGIKILGRIESPGTIEGGDVAWIDEQTLVVGHGYRSNMEGFKQLEKLLLPFGIELIQVQLPHYKGPQDVFHLMSMLSPVDKDLAVVYSRLMPIYLRKLLLESGYNLVEVPDEEYDSMGCNVLALSPRECLMVKGNPKTKSLLVKAGCKVIEYNGDHISVMGGGGPTCLTRPIYRLVPPLGMKK